ncbi:MAG: galactose-6-phosphate isomerase subunit LacB [Candidatus Tyloplasma litorale]|nr:MAG: galactose-6-phosphate isomerase subunit LacB [Mycoplasmatales bacterium]
MERKRIAIGCDHIVTPIKNQIKNYLISQGHDVVDCGTYDTVRTHYPIFGKRVAEEVVNNNFDFGVVICGTGVGISNSAQKVKGARVALVRDLYTARKAREQYNANIIAFGGRITGPGIIEEAIDIFRKTEFKGDQELVDYLDGIIPEEANKNVYFKKQLDKWDKGEYHD